MPIPLRLLHGGWRKGGRGWELTESWLSSNFLCCQHIALALHNLWRGVGRNLGEDSLPPLPFPVKQRFKRLTHLRGGRWQPWVRVGHSWQGGPPSRGHPAPTGWHGGWEACPRGWDRLAFEPLTSSCQGGPHPQPEPHASRGSVYERKTLGAGGPPASGQWWQLRRRRRQCRAWPSRRRAPGPLVANRAARQTLRPAAAPPPLAHGERPMIPRRPARRLAPRQASLLAVNVALSSWAGPRTPRGCRASTCRGGVGCR